MIRRAVLAMGPVLLAVGCGFHPVYLSSRPDGALPRIDVDPLPERTGQLIRAALQARLPPPCATSARYGLAVQFGVTGESSGVLADSTATRLRFIGVATYALLDRDTGLVVQRGAARALDGVDVVDQQLLAADLAAETVRARLAALLAEQIVTQIAARLRA